MASMFEQLMELPLFRGVSHTRLAEVVGSTKLHFLKYPHEEVLVRTGDPCTHLMFVMSGSVRVVTMSQDSRFAVSQTLNPPAVIAPEFLFGRSPNYPCSVAAIDDVSVLQIAKTEYTKILNADPVFLFNYLNALSASAQKGIQGILALTGELEERIAFWVVSLTQTDGKDICLSCRKRDLCTLFGVQRVALNATLESMKQRGLIDYNNEEIFVNDRAEMLKILTHKHE